MICLDKIKKYTLLFLIIGIIFLLFGCDSPKKEKNIKIPISSEDSVGKQYQKIEKSLKKIGYKNINLKEVTTINDDSKRGLVKQIKINDRSKFKKGDTFNETDKIEILYYTTKYDVEVKVKCKENLFLSKYDVDIYIDNKKMETIDHGKSTTINLKLNKGKHTICFKNKKEKDIDGRYNFNVQENTKYKFDISCRSSQIDVNVIKFLKMPISSDTVQEYTYKDLRKAFKDKGFTNIKCEKIKDLTDENSEKNKKVESIKIGKNSTFKIDDKYFSNSKIIIKYHVLAEPLKEESIQEDNVDSNTSDETTNTTSLSNELDDFDAKYYFSHYVEKKYALPIKVHYIVDCLACEKQQDGSYFIKCGATVTNIYGKKVDAVVEGYISGTEDNYQVYNVNVY